MNKQAIPHLIEFDSQSAPAVCMHEAAHAVAAMVLELPPAMVELLTDTNGNYYGRNRIPIGDQRKRSLISCAGYAVEYHLFKQERLVDATGQPIELRQFIQTSVGNNAAADKVIFHGTDNSDSQGVWPKADDERFMANGAGLASMLPILAVEQLATDLLNRGKLNTGEISTILSPWFDF
jgi:hypothetical protein